jgi:rhomboid family GlyGly-CTERM serine protease
MDSCCRAKPQGIIRLGALVASYRVTLLLTLPALLILAIPGAEEALQYDRVALTDGQCFRLLTCHWTHWNVDHAFWDILTFSVLSAWCERHSRWGLLAATFASAGAISTALWCKAELPTYRGLSGLDSALFAYVAAALLQHSWSKRQWFFIGLGALLVSSFAAKVSFELLTGATLFVDATAAHFLPVPFVHAIGAIVGASLQICGTALRPLGDKSAQRSLVQGEK